MAGELRHQIVAMNQQEEAQLGAEAGQAVDRAGRGIARRRHQVNFPGNRRR